MKDGRSNFYGVGALIIIHDQKVPYFIFFLFWSNLTPPLLPLTNKIALLKSHKLFKIRFQSRPKRPAKNFFSDISQQKQKLEKKKVEKGGVTAFWFLNWWATAETPINNLEKMCYTLHLGTVSLQVNKMVLELWALKCFLLF